MELICQPPGHAEPPLHLITPTHTHPPILGCSYTWNIYASRLVTLSHIYTFWKHVTSLESRETKRYLGGFRVLPFV